jgi:hypothetical protein
VGVAIACLPLAIRSTRNVGFFLIAAVPAMTCLLAPVMRPGRPPKGENPRLNVAMMAAAIAVGVVLIALVWRNPPARMGWQPIAPAAVQAVQSCSTPFYNTYADGGVLIWFARKPPVFIDNRQDPYASDLLRSNRAAELSGDYANLFQQYGVRCAALPPNSPIANRLKNDAQWTISYQDRQWLVAAKRPGRP